jgi:hypothetical protein
VVVVLIAVCGAGYRGSVTFHDANRLLIARVSNYVQRCSGLGTQAGEL